MRDDETYFFLFPCLTREAKATDLELRLPCDSLLADSGLVAGRRGWDWSLVFLWAGWFGFLAFVCIKARLVLAGGDFGSANGSA